MSLCFDCLLEEDPNWVPRYRMAGFALFVLGLLVFPLPFDGFAIVAQGFFFALAFAWLTFPLFAARRPARPNQRRTIQRD